MNKKLLTALILLSGVLMGFGFAYYEQWRILEDINSDSKTANTVPDTIDEAKETDKVQHTGSSKPTFDEIILSTNKTMSLDFILAVQDEREQFALLSVYADEIADEDYPVFLNTLFNRKPEMAMWFAKIWINRDFENAKNYVFDQLLKKHAGEALYRANQMAQEVFSEWLMRDKKSAMNFLEHFRDKTDEYTKDYLFSSLVNKYPEEAIAFIREGRMGGQSSRYDYYYAGIFSSLYEKNPMRAMELMNNLPDGKGREEAINGILGRMYETDPRAAVELIKDLREEERSGHMNNLFSSMVWNNPEAAMELFNEIASNKEEAGAVDFDRDNALSTLSYLQTSSLLEFIKSAELSESERVSMIKRHVDNKNNQAANYEEILMSLVDEKSKEDLAKSFIANIAYNDARKGIERWNELPQEKKTEEALGMLIRTMSWQSPKDAMDLLSAEFSSGFMTEKSRKELFSVVLNNVIRNNPETASVWVNSIQDEHLRNAGRLQVALADDNYDPMTLLPLIEESNSAPDTRYSYMQVARRLSERNPEKLITFLSGTKNKEWVKDALSETMSSYVSISENDAADFLDSLSGNKEIYTEAVKCYMNDMVYRDPVQALERARDLPEGEDRDQRIRDALRSLKEKDEAKAKEWSRVYGVSEEDDSGENYDGDE